MGNLDGIDSAESGMQRAEAAVRATCAELKREGVAPVLVCGALLHAGVLDVGLMQLNPDQQVLVCSVLEELIAKIRNIHDESGLP